jgi:hypothetical protein
VVLKTANDGIDVNMDDPATLSSTASEKLNVESPGKFSSLFNILFYFYLVYAVDENSDNRATEFRPSAAALEAPVAASTSMIEDVNHGKLLYIIL